jgi:hypothetical protein
MSNITIHLRRDAKIQFDNLIAECKSFRRNVGMLHHFVACRAACLSRKASYHPRSEVQTVSITLRKGAVLEMDFRVEDGPRVVVEAYYLHAG